MVEAASGDVVGKRIGPLFDPRGVAIAPNDKFAYIFANKADGGSMALYVVDISRS